MPACAYGALFASAVIIWHRPQETLFGVAAVSVSLMFIGIHNAWDIAVWNCIRKQDDST